MPRCVVEKEHVRNQIQIDKRMAKKEKKCCGNCYWFDNEDVEGAGWCTDFQGETSCDLVCDNHLNR